MVFNLSTFLVLLCNSSKFSETFCRCKKREPLLFPAQGRCVPLPLPQYRKPKDCPLSAGITGTSRALTRSCPQQWPCLSGFSGDPAAASSQQPFLSGQATAGCPLLPQLLSRSALNISQKQRHGGTARLGSVSGQALLKGAHSILGCCIVLAENHWSTLCQTKPSTDRGLCSIVQKRLIQFEGPVNSSHDAELSGGLVLPQRRHQEASKKHPSSLALWRMMGCCSMGLMHVLKRKDAPHQAR